MKNKSNIIEISDKNIKDIKCDDVMFFTYAESGAMGEGGAINLLNKEKKIYHTNYVYGDFNIKKLFKVFPPLENLKCFIHSVSGLDSNWKYIDMGFGNYLFIRKDIFKKFEKKLKEEIPEDTDFIPGFIYNNWDKIGIDLLSGNKGKSCKKDSIREDLQRKYYSNWTPSVKLDNDYNDKEKLIIFYNEYIDKLQEFIDECDLIKKKNKNLKQDFKPNYRQEGGYRRCTGSGDNGWDTRHKQFTQRYKELMIDYLHYSDELEYDDMSIKELDTLKEMGYYLITLAKKEIKLLNAQDDISCFMNKVILKGYITKRPEIRKLDSGVKCATFVLGVKRNYKNVHGNYDMDFLCILCWREIAEKVREYRDKEFVELEGHIQTRTYIDDKNEKKFVTEVYCTKIEKVEFQDQIIDKSNKKNQVKIEDKSFMEKIKEVQANLQLDKIIDMFPNGIVQMNNIAKAINYYTNGKIKPEELYKLYIRDWTFFKIDSDIYSFYNHMNRKYKNKLNDEEKINLMAVIITNISNSDYIFNENEELSIVDYIKETISIIDENDTKDVMKGSSGLFGKEPTNPIPVNGHNGLEEYFNNLLLENGHAIEYKRIGSVKSITDIKGIIDKYLILDKENNMAVGSLYVCIYNKYTTKKVPDGFLKNIKIKDKED